MLATTDAGRTVHSVVDENPTICVQRRTLHVSAAARRTKVHITSLYAVSSVHPPLPCAHYPRVLQPLPPVIVTIRAISAPCTYEALTERQCPGVLTI
jgi:hypothetical protein